jgi:hypothetical protein
VIDERFRSQNGRRAVIDERFRSQNGRRAVIDGRFWSKNEELYSFEVLWISRAARDLSIKAG